MLRLRLDILHAVPLLIPMRTLFADSADMTKNFDTKVMQSRFVAGENLHPRNRVGRATVLFFESGR